MNKKIYFILLSLIVVLLIQGCRGSRLGSAKKHEKVLMNAPPKRDVINYALLKKQQEKPLTLADRGENSRGLVTAFAGGLISLGVTAVKQVIAHENSKYYSQWTQGLNDLYFYDQPSSVGPFDPTGMQFNGFNVTRTFEDDDRTLTAVSADFEVDKDSIASNEIINNALFRLKLKRIRVNYSKAKVPFNQKTINMDFDIVFTASYLSNTGQIFKDTELGRFSLNLRNAPLDSAASGYNQYYDKFKNMKLYGKCFIVPRSFGYYKTPDNTVVSLYNQGMFSIAVNVVESSKSKFVNQLLIKTADIGLDYEQSVLLKNLQKKPLKK